MATETIERFDLIRAPMRIGRVRLKVRDLVGVSRFYRDIIGLGVVDEAPGRVTLGVASTPLLDLVGDPTLAPRDPRAAGLFHTAFLLPDRSDLGRWLRFAAERRLTLHGASDHGVSEALYLADPEHNGIEIYADRPTSAWTVSGGQIEMVTEPLDIEDLLDAADGRIWAGMPEGTTIGHLHLQVGDTAAAERFYHDALGLDVTCRYRGASFFGAGGYHHQLAANIWNSRGAGLRPERMAGLDGFEIILGDGAARAALAARAGEGGWEVSDGGDRTTIRDPSGIAVTLRH